MKRTAPEKANPSNRYLVPALYRGLKVLELLAESPNGLSLGDMTARLRLPSASLYRMLMTLVELNYAVREGNDLYRLSRKILSLGYKSIDESSVLEKSLGPMRQLRDASSETVLVSTLYGDEGIVLNVIASLHAVKVTVHVGHHFPLHTAAPGKAMLAYLPEEERNRITQSIVYTRFNPNTITNASDLEKELAAIRETGVAYDRGEEVEEIRCVAAPVFNHHGYPIAAICVSGPLSRMGKAKIKEHAESVKEYADMITSKFS